MYDFAIAGAGPAGLAAAITAASSGKTAVVIEKGPIAGPEPRGESMPHHELFDNLVRPDFLKDISGFTSTSRRFHSPADRKSTLVKIKEPYYFFEWRDFIDPIFKKAKSLGVEFIFNAEVHSVMTDEAQNSSESSPAAGLVYMKDGKSFNVEAGTVLGCGGRSCPVAAHYGIDTRATACPTVKYRGRMNGPLPDWLTELPGDPDLQFFTVLPDSFKSVTGFPPAFAYIFPLGDGLIEAGLMLRLSQFEKLKNVHMPSDTDVMTAWEEAKNSLPGFSDFFTGTDTVYEKLTSIQNRRFISENIMPGGRAVLLGDAVGMVDANGSAGLYYAMAHASSWVKMLDDKSPWADGKIKEYYSTQSSWDFYRYIRSSFKLISIFERLMFRNFGTEKKLNRVWPLIAGILKSAS